MKHEAERPENADEWLELLPLWIGGDLEQAEADRIAKAVADSDWLADRAAELASARAALIDGLATAIESEPVPDLWPGVRSGLVAEGILVDRSAAPRGRVLSFFREKRVASVAAAAALVACVGLAMSTFGTNSPSEPAPSTNTMTLPVVAVEEPGVNVEPALADAASGLGLTVDPAVEDAGIRRVAPGESIRDLPVRPVWTIHGGLPAESGADLASHKVR